MQIKILQSSDIDENSDLKEVLSAKRCNYVDMGI